MDNDTAILVDLLARTDAIFIPLRDWSRRRVQNVYAARVAFKTAGVAWDSGERTEAGRKAASRKLEQLAADGMVQIRRPRKLRAVHVSLTDAGDEQTRLLIGLPGLYSGWISVAEIGRRSKRPGKQSLMEHLWISERKLANFYLPEAELVREVVLVEDLALPAIVRGYLGSCSDRSGRVYYGVCRSGWTWLDAGQAPPEEPDGATPDLEARELYLERLKATQERLATAAPSDPRQIGELHLPESIGGLRLQGPWNPEN